MGLEIRIDTNEAAAAIADLRKNITALGGDTKLSAEEIQKLEERLRKQMGADAAADALRKLQQQTGMTDDELARLAKQMGANDAEIQKLIKSQNDYANSQKQASNTASGFKDILKEIAGSIAGLAGAYFSVDFLKSAVQYASEFEVAVTDIGKVGSESFDTIRERIMSLDPSLATGTEVAKTYYQAISAGAKEGAEAMDLSVVAIKAGEAAHVSSADTLVGLSKIISGYKGEVKSATEAADIMYGIEKAGQTTFSQLVPVIGNVASMTNEAGLSATEMGGALALMTQTAGSTAQASTQLIAMSRELVTPQKELAAAIKATGFESAGALIQQYGFTESMKMLSAEAEKGGQKLNQLFSSSEAGAGAVALAANNFDKLKGSIETVTNSTGALDAASEAYGETFEAKVDDIATLFDRIRLYIGEDLRDAAKPTLDAINEGLTYIAEHEEEVRAIAQGFVIATQGAIDFGLAISGISGYAEMLGLLPEDLRGIENAIELVKLTWNSFIGGANYGVTFLSGEINVFVTRMKSEWYSGIANISSAWNGMIAYIQKTMAEYMGEAASMISKIPFMDGVAEKVQKGADALKQWSLARKTSAAIDGEAAARLTENAKKAVADAKSTAEANNFAAEAAINANEKGLLAEKELREFRKVVKAERKEQGDFEAGIAEFEANANESSIKRQFGAIKGKDKAKKESADKSIKEIEREMEAYARLEKKMEEFTGKLSEETDAIYSDSGSDKTVQMIEKRRKEYEKLNDELREQAKKAKKPYQENAEARVALEDWSVAQIYKSNKELNEKIESELEASLGSRENAEKAKIDREYANYEKSLNAQIELLKNMGKTETDEYQALLTTKENAQKLHLAKLEKNEKDRLNRQRDFEIEYLKAVDPNNAALKQLESEKRESEIREKYKYQDQVKVQQMIEADKADAARKEQEKLTADIQGMWKNMMSGISADATGAFALTGANISKMAGNLLDMAKSQGKGNAAAGFSQLFSGQVKSGDPLSGLSALGSQLSSGYKTLVESGTSIGNLVGDIDVGIKSFFGSASKGILSGVPWGNIASGALSLLSGGFSAKNIASTVASTAASIFLPGVGTLLAPVIGKLVGSLFGNKAGWGIGVDAGSVKWGEKVGSLSTSELKRSSGDGGEESRKLVKAFESQINNVIEPVTSAVGTFLKKLPEGAQAKANEILADAKIEWGNVINWSQDSDQQTRTRLNLSYIQDQAVKTAAEAVNAANSELAAGYNRSTMAAGGAVDKLLDTIGAGFKWVEADWNLSEEEKIAYREKQAASFEEYLGLVDQFNELMSLGDTFIENINAQLEPMTEYESALSEMNNSLNSLNTGYKTLAEIGYSEERINEIRAEGAKLVAAEEEKWAKKRADQLADARETYGLDGLTEYQRKIKSINDDFANREETLRQSGASEEKYQEDLITLSNIKAQALAKEAEAYRQNREAIFAEMESLLGLKPDLSEYESGLIDLKNKIEAYGKELVQNNASPEDMQRAAGLEQSIMAKQRSSLLSKSGELSGRNSALSDSQTEINALNKEFSGLANAGRLAGLSVEEMTQMQKDYTSATDKLTTKYEGQRTAILESIDALAGWGKNVSLLGGAVVTTKDKFNEAASGIIKAGGNQADLDNLSSKWGGALTNTIKEAMFGNVNAQSLSNMISSGVNKIFEDAKNGIAPNFSTFGSDIQKGVNIQIQTSLANTEIGATSDLIYDTWINPILTGLADKAKNNGGVLSNEDIAEAYFPKDDPLMQEVANRAAERAKIQDNATKGVYKSAEEMTAALLAVDTKYQAATDFVKENMQKPIDVDAPKYKLPEYDTAVEIEPPTFEFTEPYNPVIKLHTPVFEVSTSGVSAGGTATMQRHPIARAATGIIGIPSDFFPAYLDKDEMVVNAGDVPFVVEKLTETGRIGKYRSWNTAERVNGIPRFELGGWSGTTGSVSLSSTAQSSGGANGIIAFFAAMTQQNQANANMMRDAESRRRNEEHDNQARQIAIAQYGSDQNQKLVNEIKQKLLQDESKAKGQEIWDITKSDYTLAPQFAEINKLLKGVTADPESKMSAEIAKAKTDAAAMTADIRAKFGQNLNEYMVQTYGEEKGNQYAATMNKELQAVEDKMVGDIKSRYDAERKAAVDNLTAYKAGLSGEKAAIDEVAKAKEDADKSITDFAQKIADAGGQVDIAAEKTEAYAAITANFAKQVDSIKQSANDRIATLRGESTETVEKAVKAETQQWDDWIASAKAKGASDKELTDLQTDAAEAIKLVTKATQDKIDADKLSAITSANDRYADLTGIIDYTSKKAKAIADETANWDKWIATAESSGASTAELTELRRKEAIAIDKVAENIDKEAMARENEAKSIITDQSSGLLGNIDDFMFGLNGKNKFEEKLKSWQGKTISTEDDLNAFMGDQIALYQDKFDKLADTYQGWSDVRESASEALSSFDIEPVIESIRDVPKRLDDSLTSVTDYIADMQEWAENAKQLRSDFVNLQSSIAESRARISADLGTAGMSKLDTLNSKIGSGMASLQALSPEEGLAKAQELRDLVMERYDEEKNQVQSVSDSISKMKDLADSLKKKSDDLKYSDFNLTKGVARQDMMAQDYQSLLAKAKSGDASAVSDYTGFIDKYLAQSQQMYASSGQYTAIYAQVQSDIASLGAGITNKIPAQEAYLASLNTVASETNALLDQLSGYTEQQITSIDTGLEENRNAIELLLGDSGPIVMGQQQTVNAIGELKTVVNQSSQDNAAIMQALLAILNKDGIVSVNIDGDTLVNIVVSKVNKAAENGLQLLNV